jgi:RNA polymerase sigma-70 factor (ECF subfamily)
VRGIERPSVIGTPGPLFRRENPGNRVRLLGFARLGGVPVEAEEEQPGPVKAEGAGRGDARGADLTGLLDRLRPGVWAYLRVLGADAALADDLWQEAAVVVLRKQPGFATDLAARAYLRETARNLWLTHVRKEARRAQVVSTENPERAAAETDGAFDGIEDRGGWEGYLAALRECMAGLDDDGREMLRLCYAEKFGGAEIGRRVGMSEAAAHQALSRIRKRLKVCIEARMRKEQGA